jgi:hypothetical protein
MGVWGTGLYQDDIASDIKDLFSDQLRRGKTAEELVIQICDEFSDVMTDPEYVSVFWFVLADILWSLGKLTEEIKTQALYYLDQGTDLERWRSEDAKLAKKREVVLDKLKTKLNSPQPPEKTIRPYRLYQCQWKIGDVYAYALDYDHAREKGVYGRHLLFYKVTESEWHPGHIIPVVWVKITEGDRLPESKEEFNQLEFLSTYDRKYHRNALRPADHNQTDIQPEDDSPIPQYRLRLINTSKRIIPKKLVFVDNYQNVTPPENEYVQYNDYEIQGWLWKYFDKPVLDWCFRPSRTGLPDFLKQ